MNDRDNAGQKKRWQEPGVERLADLRDVRGGIFRGGREAGVFYMS